MTPTVKLICPDDTTHIDEDGKIGRSCDVLVLEVSHLVGQVPKNRRWKNPDDAA